MSAAPANTTAAPAAAAAAPAPVVYSSVPFTSSYMSPFPYGGNVAYAPSVRYAVGNESVVTSQAPLPLAGGYSYSQPVNASYVGLAPTEWQRSADGLGVTRTTTLAPAVDPLTRTPMYATNDKYADIDNNAFYLRVDPNVRGGAGNSLQGYRAEGYVTPSGEYVYTYNKPITVEGPVPVTRHPFPRDVDVRAEMVKYYIDRVRN